MAFQKNAVLIGTLSSVRQTATQNIDRTRGKLVNHELLGLCFHLNFIGLNEVSLFTATTIDGFLAKRRASGNSGILKIDRICFRN